MARRDPTGPEFLDQYVFGGGGGFIPRDVGRAIGQARAGEDAPNFPIALALLCYTEALGRYVPGVGPTARARFEAFFRKMGPLYAAQLDDPEQNPYREFRCGMAHSYMIEGNSQVSMRLNDDGAPACGIGIREHDYRYVNIERYFTDFMRAAHELWIELVGHRHPLAHLWT